MSERHLIDAKAIQVIEPEGFEPMGNGVMGGIQRIARYEPDKRWAADTVEWLAATALHYFARAILAEARSNANEQGHQ